MQSEERFIVIGMKSSQQ